MKLSNHRHAIQHQDAEGGRKSNLQFQGIYPLLILALGIAMCPLHTRTAVLVLFLLTSVVASGATVYRWVDDQGKVNYSETDPEQFRSRAKAIDASANQPSAAQQQESLERAQRERERAAASSPDSTRQPAKSAGAASAPQASTKIPSRIPNEHTDCET